MRFTNTLYAQHIGWMFKKHWQVQGRRTPKEFAALAELEKYNISVQDPNDVINSKPKLEIPEIVGYKPIPLLEDTTHPDWHDQVCHVYRDKHVLLEGFKQAQVLTKSIEITGFPKNIEEAIQKMQLPSNVDRNVQNCIMAAHIFDAEQVKLSKLKVEGKPMVNLPRILGISQERRQRLLLSKLLSECEKLAGHAVKSRRRIAEDAKFVVTLSKDDDLLQFAIKAEKLLTAAKPIEPIRNTYTDELPELYPIKYTISIPQKNVYKTDLVYPLSSGISCSNPHTIFLHFDREFVGNLHGSSVSTSQFQGRTLTKAFAVAATRAKQIYGDAVQSKLPKPIVVQCVHTDGRSFHFGVFQLNTLDLTADSEPKNYWFHESNMDLFSECGYKEGRPVLEAYNKDVFRCINAFYSNS